MLKKLTVTAIETVFSMLAYAETYGVLMKTLLNPFWGAMELGVSEGAKVVGVEYYLQSVASDQAAEPRLDVIEVGFPFIIEQAQDAGIELS